MSARRSITFLRQSRHCGGTDGRCGPMPLPLSNMMKAGAVARPSQESAIMYNISCCEKTDVMVGRLRYIRQCPCIGEVCPATLRPAWAMKLIIHNKCPGMKRKDVEQSR